MSSKYAQSRILCVSANNYESVWDAVSITDMWVHPVIIIY